jgi:hypothetical protein
MEQVSLFISGIRVDMVKSGREKVRGRKLGVDI